MPEPTLNGFHLGERVTWQGRPAIIRGWWASPALSLEFDDGSNLTVGIQTVRHSTFQEGTDA